MRMNVEELPTLHAIGMVTLVSLQQHLLWCQALCTHQSLALVTYHHQSPTLCHLWCLAPVQHQVVCLWITRIVSLIPFRLGVVTIRISYRLVRLRIVLLLVRVVQMAQLRAAVLDYLVSIILERFLAHVFLLFLQLLHLFNIALNIILLDSRIWTKHVCRKYHSPLPPREWTTLLSSDDILDVI